MTEKRALTGAYARGLYHAVGVDEIEAAPLIGIANSASELVPGHAHLDLVAEAVKGGVARVGGVPLAFNPSPCATASARGAACTPCCPAGR